MLIRLYTAAGEACLANWASAKAALSQVNLGELCEINSPSASSFETDAVCQDARLRVYRWTEDLLKAHGADPAFVPNFQPPPES